MLAKYVAVVLELGVMTAHTPVVLSLQISEFCPPLGYPILERLVHLLRLLLHLLVNLV